MIRMNPKLAFFDSEKVRRAVDKTTRRVLSKFGAYVRRSAKSSIRKRKRASKPGQPPSSHTGLLKRFIFFGYDRDKRSVVIGPAELTKNDRGEAPSVLEYGGTVRLERNGKRKRKVNVRIQKRPFMEPAFEKEQKELPQMWKDSVQSP